MARLLAMLRPALLVPLVVLLVLAVLLALVWLGQRRLVYLPDRDPVPPAARVLPGGEDVRLATSDGLALGAWYVPAHAAGRNLTVLVLPGNGGNRAGRVPLALALSRAGFTTLLLDYRGYGGNPGDPTEAGLARDARAAYRHLVDERGIPPHRLIYFGESLGAGVATGLAAEHRPGGLLLRSPFTDLAAAGAEHYPFLPVGALLWDRFPVADRLAAIDVPTAVVYGERDSVVPPEQSREVARRAAGPVAVTGVAGAEHNDPALASGPDLVAAVVALAERVDPSPVTD